MIETKRPTTETIISQNRGYSSLTGLAYDNNPATNDYYSCEGTGWDYWDGPGDPGYIVSAIAGWGARGNTWSSANVCYKGIHSVTNGSITVSLVSGGYTIYSFVGDGSLEVASLDPSYYDAGITLSISCSANGGTDEYNPLGGYGSVEIYEIYVEGTIDGTTPVSRLSGVKVIRMVAI